MAFTEFYCNASTGSNLYAGSTEAAPLVTYTSGTWVQSTRVFTVASGNPTGDGVTVGMWASVYPDGTSAPAVFIGRVTACDATTITISSTAKFGTAPTDGTSNRTLVIGGPWKGPNAADGFPFGSVASVMTNASNNPPRVNFKNNATYSITAGVTCGTGSNSVTFQGYSSTPGDGGKATIDGGTTNATLMTINSSANLVADMIVANNATGSGHGWFFAGFRVLLLRLVAHDVRGSGIFVSDGIIVECEAYACNASNGSGQGGFQVSGGGGGIANFANCIAHDNTGSNSAGFVLPNCNAFLTKCVADTNGGDGVRITGSLVCVIAIDGCDFYNNGSDGIEATPSGATPMLIRNCNFVKNGGYGINANASSIVNGFIYNCGYGAGTQVNTSGATNISATSGIVEVGAVTYTNDVTPWTDPANGDFRISLAAAKSAGRGAFTETAASYAGTVGYPDIGAAQHQEIVGGNFYIFGPKT